MITSFAEINTTVDNALVAQRDSAVLSAVEEQRAFGKARRHIAGFLVCDKQIQQREVAKILRDRQKRIDQFYEDRRGVRADLDKLGIQPLAIVPKSFWERICSESGLFRLNPDRKGRVGISTSKILDDFKQEVENLFSGPIQAAMMFIPTLVGLICFVTLFDWPWEGIVCAVIGTFAVFGLLTGFVYSSPTLDLHKEQSMRRRIKRFCKKPWAQILDEFFPDGKSSHSSTKTKLILPTPPADVEVILLKAQSLELKVAAVAGAISFADTPRQILLREQGRLISEGMMWRNVDPIVYYECGGAVAVIAQFGGFPIEQEVVEMAMSSEHLI